MHVLTYNCLTYLLLKNIALKTSQYPEIINSQTNKRPFNQIGILRRVLYKGF